MQTVLLDKSRHDRLSFDCGVEPLNHYLRLMASQQARRDNSRTFVVEDAEQPGCVMGFYTLTMTLLDVSALPAGLRKKHVSATSAGLIARLAVDRRYQGRGLGEWLLVDALRKLLEASDRVGFPVVVVDAKDGVRGFYEKFGFMGFADEGGKLFMTVGDLREGSGRD